MRVNPPPTDEGRPRDFGRSTRGLWKHSTLVPDLSAANQLLDIIRDERQKYAGISLVVRASATTLPSLQVTRRTVAVRRHVVHNSAALRIGRSTKVVVVVVCTLGHTVIETRASRVRAWRRGTVGVAEEVSDVLACEVEAVVDAVDFAVLQGDD